VPETGERSLRVAVSERAGSVAALLRRPAHARWLAVLAHGAGADMRHPFMEHVAAALAERGVATLRFQFPYTEAGRGRPDPAPVLERSVRAAVAAAAREAPGLPLLAGGKSMGGRITSQAQAREPLPGVRGIFFLGFPLHAARRPDAARAEHLAQVALPLLFLQGTRDALADLSLLRPAIARLGARAALHVVEDADHSFRVPKRSGRSEQDVLAGLADGIVAWAEEIS
jgi:predicted alpha/beta-hydrolase family hydrolase